MKRSTVTILVLVAVGVGVRQAVAIAVVAVSRVIARTVVIGSLGIEVARCRIITTGDLEFVADAVAVGIVQAVAVAIDIGRVRVRAAAIIGRGCSVVVAGRIIGTAGNAGTEVEGVAEFIRTIAIDEHLDVDLSAEFTRRGELTRQHLEVIAGHTVGVAVQGVPCATDSIVDGDVATGQPTARIEVGEPRVVVGLDRAHVGLTGEGIRRACETDGHPRVVSEVWVDREEQAVDAIRNTSTQGGVVKVRRGLDIGWIRRIPRHRRQEVSRSIGRHIDVRRAVARQVGHTEGTDEDADVLIDDFDFDAVSFRCSGRIDRDLLLSIGGGKQEPDAGGKGQEVSVKAHGSVIGDEKY